MPVRKIPKNARSVTGLLVSQDKEEMKAYESTLERDLMEIVWFDQNVLRFEEQPVEIKFTGSDGKLHSYIPDLLVIYRQDISKAIPLRPMLCEVKYRADLFKNWKELKPKVRAGRAYAKEKDWTFKIWTEVELRTPYLFNVKFLRKYRTIPTTTEQIEQLLKTADKLQATDPETLLQTIHNDRIQRAMLMPTLWYLISIGKIGTDLDQKLTMRSRIWSIKKE